MAQGFPREEAEHLAVQEMGPVARTNRALLGHALTNPSGWVVLGLLLLAAVPLIYMERHRFVWPDTHVQEAEFTLKEVAGFQPIEGASRRKLTVVLPKGTRSLEFATIGTQWHDQHQILGGTGRGVESPDWNRPVQLTIDR